MELTTENLKKPEYWLELPLEIVKGALSELFRQHVSLETRPEEPAPSAST